MTDQPTTQVLQEFLDQMTQPGNRYDSQSPLIQQLIERAAHRLHVLCDKMLKRNYPRLTRPPANLESEELLSGVVERLIKAMAQIQPLTVRQFFALANQHLRWELNDLARRLDEERVVTGLSFDAVPAPESHGSELSTNARFILDAIENLPAELREAFDLVRIQGLTQPEAASILQISTKTIQRRIANSLMRLTESLKNIPLQSGRTSSQ